MKIRIDEQLWARLSAELLRDPTLETAAILMGEVLGMGAERVVAIREGRVVPEDGYDIRKPDRLRINAVTLNRLTRPARDNGWAILTVHTHGSESPPQFSWADDQGDARLMPAFGIQVPNVPHGSMVISTTGEVTARLFEGDSAPARAEVITVGRLVARLRRSAVGDEAWFDRQRLALGATGQAQLRQLTVAVVGLGGIGSVVAMQLAHLGVGELLLVDGDLLEATNLSRVLGARVSDVGRMPKVDIAARYVVETGLPVRVRALGEHLTDANLGELAAADVIVACVDRHTPRALLNRLAYRALVPMIDTGTVFRVGPDGRLAGEAGRVVVVGPGRRCLSCWGHLSADALRVEALSAEERQSLAQEGYVQGADVPEPSVIGFNGAVGSHAVIEVMRMATAFAGAEEPPARLAFSFTEATVRRNRLTAPAVCRVCGGA